jgi:hypothetical protein
VTRGVPGTRSEWKRRAKNRLDGKLQARVGLWLGVLRSVSLLFARPRAIVYAYGSVLRTRYRTNFGEDAV